MAVVFDYLGKVILPSELPEGVLDEWKQTLKAEKARILAGIQAKIPDVDAYRTYLAEPSADGYESFVNPDYPDADEIKLKQRVKVLGAGQDYLNEIQRAFSAESTYFEEQIDNKANRYDKARYTLALVGHAPTIGYGPAMKAIMFATGDARVLKYITGDDLYSGTPTNIFKPAHRKFVKPALIARLVFGGVYALYCADINDMSTMNNVITKTNSALDEIVGAFIDETQYAPPPTSFIRLLWDAGEGVLKVMAHAETTT